MTNDNEEPSAASGGSLAWIPVAERLPDEGVLVLAYNGRCDYGFRRDGQWIDTLYGGVLGNRPTHWMPLPAPPTDAKQPANTQDQRHPKGKMASISDAEIDALEFVVEEGRIASQMDYGVLRSLLVRLRPEWLDRPEPIKDEESDRSKPIAYTPPTHATPGECSSHGECA